MPHPQSASLAVAVQVLTAFKSGYVNKETMFAALLKVKDKP
jgi:hypothetical protein